MATPIDGDMAGTEFRGTDLQGSTFRLVDLRGSWFRQTYLTGARMRGVSLVDADIDGEIDGLRILGVEVAPLVEAELDRRHPERTALRATEPAELQAGWDALGAMWEATIERVATMAPGTEDASVDGEWSVAQTLRHLLLATDSWLGAAILGRERPFHPLGLLFSSYVGREAEYGLDPDASPTFAEVLEARAGRRAMVSEFLAAVTPDALQERRPDPWGGDWQPTVLECVQVIFNEEWHHHRYIARDLGTLAGEP